MEEALTKAGISFKIKWANDTSFLLIVPEKTKNEVVLETFKDIENFEVSIFETGKNNNNEKK